MRRYDEELYLEQAIDEGLNAVQVHSRLRDIYRERDPNVDLKGFKKEAVERALAKRTANREAVADKPLLKRDLDLSRERLEFLAAFCRDVDECITAFTKLPAEPDIEDHLALMSELSDMIQAQGRIEQPADEKEIPALIETLLECRNLPGVDAYRATAARLWPGEVVAAKTQ